MACPVSKPSSVASFLARWCSAAKFMRNACLGPSVEERSPGLLGATSIARSMPAGESASPEGLAHAQGALELLLSECRPDCREGSRQLLTFFQFAKEYWPRTTNPSERLNKDGDGGDWWRGEHVPDSQLRRAHAKLAVEEVIALRRQFYAHLKPRNHFA